MKNLSYRVKTFREAGLEARWTTTRHGAPIIAARDPQAATCDPIFPQGEKVKANWYVVDNRMWQAMLKEGVREAFERFTLLGDIFSVPA